MGLKPRAQSGPSPFSVAGGHLWDTSANFDLLYQAMVKAGGD
jgi:hypothetical protein